MAKGKPAGGVSRIRFVMFDAEIADGDLEPITQAIQNALRGPVSANTPVKRLAAPVRQVNGGAEEPPETVEEIEDVEVADESQTAPKIKTPRKAGPKPTIIDDIDIKSEPPLSSLVDPGSNIKRYLVIAAWLHDHRNTEVITADHIFTCYRHLNWPIDIPYFSQPLRFLKHKQYLTTPERGKYAINQLGLSKAAEASSD
jgi:hypothetical protein